MQLDIKKLTGNNAPFSRRILLYGDPSSGKTHFIGTAQDVPELRDVLLVDIDGGGSTLFSRGDISSVEMKTTKSVEQLLWLIVQKDPSVANIKTLVLDGTSDLQKRDLQDIATAGAAKSNEGGRAKPRDEDMNELLDYKVNKSRMLRMFRMARDMTGITVVVTAWARKTFPKSPSGQANKNSMPTLIVPDLSDAINDVVVGMFDDCFYTYYDTEAKTYNMVTNNYGPVKAKCRNPEIAKQLCNSEGFPVLVNPTFADVYKAYKTVYT